MTLKFSKNWGNKLDDQVFTTIRQDNSYWQTQVKEKHDILLKGEKYCEAALIWVIPISIDNITESLAREDADMSRKDLVKMLKSMYGENPDLQLLCWEKIFGSQKTVVV